MKYNSVALLLGYNQVFFHPEVLDFLPIYFPHILSISGKPHLFSWLLVGFVALRPKSTAMVIAGRSVHLTTLFPGQA